MTRPNAPLITGDDVCGAVEAALRASVPAVAEKLGWPLKPVEWEQVPDLKAFTKAQPPVGMVTSPGLVSDPVRGRNDDGEVTTDATWRVVVGAWDRGGSWRATAQLTRRWAAVIRAAVLLDTTLGGLATGLRWRLEAYDQFPNVDQARTLGGCSVAFDVDVCNVIDLTALSSAGGQPVTETDATLAVTAPPAPAR